MKKLLLTFSCLLGLATVSQAQLFNSDFENWQNHGAYDDPDSFATPNSSSTTFSQFVVVKSTTAYHGSFSVNLATKTFPFAGDVPGVMTNGKLNAANIIAGTGAPVSGGRPITQRPNAFQAHYQFLNAGTDTCWASLILTRWNSTLHKTDTVGTASFQDTLNRTSWTVMRMPITYTLTGNPDTFQLIFAGGGINYATSGTSFLIDSMNFDIPVNGPAGFSSISQFGQVELFPNPVNEILTIKGLEANSKVEIFSILGAKVYSQVMVSTSPVHKFFVGNFTPGLYLIDYTDTKGQISTAKFVKE